MTETGDFRRRANRPSEAIAMGLCPGCLGHGWVHRFVPADEDGPCSTCGGTGTLAGMEDHQAFMYRQTIGQEPLFGPPHHGPDAEDP